jgi:hypothetical protein
LGRSLAVAALAVGAVTAGASAQAPGGSFSDPFAEPTIGDTRTDLKCIRRDPRPGLEPSGPLYTPFWDCKPTGGSVNVTPIRNRIAYWNALESTENINGSTQGEYGTAAVNDQSRRMDLNPLDPFRSVWSRPTPVDGGANPPPEGSPDTEFLAVPDAIGRELDPPYNDGSLFCADNNLLPDGRVVGVGGSTYKNDPPTGASGPLPGPLEVQGARNTRVYDPWTNRWHQTPKMNYGRWYPALVTLGSRGGRAGDTFVASGVKNLIKMYDEQGDPTDVENDARVNRWGDNVQETEIRNWRTGVWELQGPRAAQDPSDRPLPLFPRLHLLPNGHVYYNASGQTFNPNGGSYNEALWNLAAAFDPATRRWNDLGIPGTQPDGPQDPLPGYRGSTFSVMLTLKPENGSYRRARFLTAGGTLGPTPGAYLAVRESRISTVDTAATSAASPSGRLTTHATAPLNHPRWYSHGTVLPTGEVLASSGAREDETLAPGFETPIKQVEIFDPQTETWKVDAEANRIRTYHNTAVLLPDARVLVGGHAPLPGGNLGRNLVPQDPQHPTRPYAGGTEYNQPSSINDGRDPTFEIYTPPYLRTGQPQPAAPRAASCQPEYGGVMELELSHGAAEAASVVLVRNASVTHIVDGDQRTVELPIVGRSGNRVWVRRPPNANVAPPGPYMLFVNRRTSAGLIPSRARQLFVGIDRCPWIPTDGGGES